MSKTHRTFGTTVPAYYLGRPRSVYQARYQSTGRMATVTSLSPIRELDKAA